MRRLGATVLAGWLLAACGGEASSSPPDLGAQGPGDGATPDLDAPSPDGSDAPPLASLAFERSDAVLLNPERGWMEGGGISLGADGATGGYGAIRTAGYTLAYAKVRLDAYRNQALDTALLDALSAGFARVRGARIKVVLRFVYNDGPDADAPLSVMLGHLQQLKPLLQANADVIAVMQAGMIGQWGEWHDSTNGNDTAEAHGQLLDAILAALPASRGTMVRTPAQKAERFPKALTDGFDGSAQARIGHHNDCFLASDDDYGTYQTPIDTWKQYVADDGRFVFVGGETCHVNPPRSDCASATAELARLHFTFLNQLYEPNVIAGWATQGCKDQVGNSLGYRLRLVDGARSERVAPGGVLTVRLRLANDGWAAPLNERPVYLVLERGARRLVAALAGVDPRRWAAGGEVQLEKRLRVPASAEPGAWRLALWLPDAAASLREVPEYALQLANTDVFQAATGDNTLDPALPIDPAAPGPVDPSATDFAELP